MSEYKRYRWAKQSEVYHDMNFATEQCNCDDMVDFEEGDEPPLQVRHTRYRRLCYMCRRHREQIEGVA